MNCANEEGFKGRLERQHMPKRFQHNRNDSGSLLASVFILCSGIGVLSVSGVGDVTSVVGYDCMGTGRRICRVSDSDCAAAFRKVAEFQSGISVFV